MLGGRATHDHAAAVRFAAVPQVLPDVLASFKPDLVLYDAGVDVHTDDALGRLAVSDAGESCGVI